ncbi:MAG TPA: CPBP family intramembrane metalloprotease [Gemmatales bacterium]|nr:CPBP family intramembrane metalloprotease [Gemmatales bacterium]
MIAQPNSSMLSKRTEPHLVHDLSWFFLFLVGYTALSFWGLSASGNYYVYMFAYMWSPALAALSVCVMTRSGVCRLRLSSWGSFRTLLLSMVIPFIYGMVSYAVIWAAGWGIFNLEQLELTVKKMGLASWPLPVAAALYVVMMGLQGTLGNMPSSLGEELGWRGFLAPRLRTQLSFPVTAIVVGLVWGIWHFPLILKNADASPLVPIAVTLFLFTLFTIAASFLFNWLSDREGSVWPAVVLHSAHNCFILGLFERMTKSTPTSEWYTGESGLVLWLAILLTTIFVRALSRRTAK